ncbi:MAG: CehA/McbA family metallohydrolase [Dehalococcoidia bacterium]
MVRSTHEFTGHFDPGEARAHPYYYVPFEVPARCQRIEVAYHFAPVASDTTEATVDIGLFDIRGTEPFTGGFRGWSGSARRSFFLERGAATPGYIVGPLPAGKWSVVLGGYEIPDGGVRWWLTVAIDHGTARRVRPASRPSIQRPHANNTRPGWYRGDFHSHTNHSDGDNTIEEMARFARKRGLDFLAITDHNTISHIPVIDAWYEAPVLLVPGEEVTTYSGHANVWGLREWVDFRAVTDAEIHAIWKFVESRGNPFSINHPKKVGPPWLFSDANFAVREVWQAPWGWYNWESVGAWDEQLANGRHIVPVGGSDAHSAPPAPARHPHDIGEPTTWVDCEGGLNEQAVLNAVTSGRTAISDSPRGPLLTLARDTEGFVTARFERARGTTLEFIADGERPLRLPVDQAGGEFVLPETVSFQKYVRAELRVPDGRGREAVRALSAPIYN